MTTITTKKQPGESISRFKIEAELGSGGMGVVYQAYDPALDLRVALKIVKAGRLDDELQVRFQQEAKALKDVQHSSIPKIYNFAISEDGTPYMVMELVEGTNLSQFIEEHGTLDFSYGQGVLVQIIDALAYAHSQGIVHRDIKPANIVLSARGDSGSSVKLIDFGLAKLKDSLQGNLDMTTTGTIMGSPPYMSPEQIRGKNVDACSDIYSMGCVIFEMFAGHPPYEGDSPLETISMHLAEPVPVLSEQNPRMATLAGLDQLIECCLAKDREERYQSMSDLKEALLEVTNIDETLFLKEEEEKQADQYESVNAEGLPLAVKIVVVGSLIALVSVLFWLVIMKDEPTVTKAVSLNNSSFDLFGNNWSYQHLKSADLTKRWGGGTKWLMAPDNVSDSDFKALSETRYRNSPNICSMSSDKLTGDGLKYVNYSSIKKLQIVSRSFSDKGFSHIGKMKNLTALILGQNRKVTISGVRQLLRLPDLKSIRWNHSTLPPGTLSVFSQLKSLQMLHLTGCKPLDKHALKELYKLPGLIYLDLTDTGLTDDKLAGIDRAQHLQELSLGQNELSDKCIDFLAPLSIESLDISHNRFSDRGLRSLTKMKKLRLLMIYGNPGLTSDNVSYIKKRLPKCEVISNPQDSRLGGTRWFK